VKTNHPRTHRRTNLMTSKPGSLHCPGKSRTITYLLVLRCPVYRGRDSPLGLRTELENLGCDAKRKGSSGGPARPKVPKRLSGADHSVLAEKQGNACGAKGVGHPRRARFGQLNNRRNQRGSTEMGWHEPDNSRGLRPVL